MDTFEQCQNSSHFSRRKASITATPSYQSSVALASITVSYDICLVLGDIAKLQNYQDITISQNIEDIWRGDIYLPWVCAVSALVLYIIFQRSAPICSALVWS